MRRYVHDTVTVLLFDPLNDVPGAAL